MSDNMETVSEMDVIDDREYFKNVAGIVYYANTEEFDLDSAVKILAAGQFLKKIHDNPIEHNLKALISAHVDFTLELAREYEWCDDVHAYLTKVWQWPTRYCAPHSQLINDVWHHSQGWTWAPPGGIQSCDHPDGAHCQCGHECNSTCRVAQSWYSFHGHNFAATDSPRQDSCYTCGALYDITVDSDYMGRYVNAHGATAAECTGRTDLVHGYDVRICEADNGRGCVDARESDNGLCEHIEHDCECVLCL